MTRRFESDAFEGVDDGMSESAGAKGGAGDKSATDRKFVNALARGLSVLGVFRASDRGLTHTEIAARSGVSKPTVTRLIHTLCETGHLIRDGQSGVVRLGPAALALGAVAQAQTSFMDLIEDDMQAFANRTGTLAVIGVRNGDRMMLVRTWRPVGTASIWLEPGHRVPVLGSSLGQAYVAALSDVAFDALAPDAALRAFRADGYAQLIAKGYTVPAPQSRFAATIKAVAVPYLAREYAAPIAFCSGATPEMLTDAHLHDTVGPGLVEIVRTLEAKTGQPGALARRG